MGLGQRVAGALAGVIVTLAAVAAEGAQGGRAAVEAVERGDYAGAATMLEEIEARDRATFPANNYDYLLGRVREHQGDLPAAAARYEAVLARGSNLAEYALWRLAGLARLEGNTAQERRHLTRLRAQFPASLLGREAFDRIAHSAMASGDHATVVQMLAPIARPQGSASRDALARLSLARLRLGDVAAARTGFVQLLSGSQDDHALAAARGLDEIDGGSVDGLEHMRRGRVYMTNRDWDGARRHFLAVVEDPGSQNRADALHHIGLTYYRVNDNDRAIEWWERAARDYPSQPFGIKSFYWVGHAHQRAGRHREALDRYAELIARFPADEQVEGAYRNAIDTARSAGEHREALLWADRAEQAKPRSALATFAVFNRAKTLLASGETARALAELVRLKSYNLSVGGAGMPSAGEVELLRGVAYERMGRLGEAVSVYLALKPGREEYFGNRATLRLLAIAGTREGRPHIEPLLSAMLSAARAARASGDPAAAKAAADRALRLTSDETVRAEMVGVLRNAYAALPAYAKVSAPALVPVARSEVGAGQGVRDRSHSALGAELAFLGLWDEAAPELEAAGFASRSSHSMMVYNARGGRAHTAVEQGERMAASLPRDYRPELLPRSVADILYPAPYRDALRKFALPIGLDPRFELSIARQESRFKPWVKSQAAARGLVQFIPETADRIAAKLGIRNFEQDDLYMPQVAIRFGARYLADLFELFPNNPYLVAASYNGGEDNVARWRKRAASPDDIDLAVAEIGFKESKTYVFRVMNNFWAYQALYTEELNPKPAP